MVIGFSAIVKDKNVKFLDKEAKAVRKNYSHAYTALASGQLNAGTQTYSYLSAARSCLESPRGSCCCPQTLPPNSNMFPFAQLNDHTTFATIAIAVFRFARPERLAQLGGNLLLL